MGICRKCKTKDSLISDRIGFCSGCIREDFSSVEEQIRQVHRESRVRFGLPPEPPQSPTMRCQDAALEAGLKNVHLGNVHLLK